MLVAGGAIAVAGLTGAPARAAARRPIFEWARPGGFFFPGEGVLIPPPLAIYDDRTAYADASASLPLRPRQAESLRAHAAEVLGDPRNYARDPDQPVRDRPVDVVSVRLEDGTFLSAELEGWGDAFPEPIRALDRHVQQLRRTVLAGGEPWRPNAIRLAVVHLDHEPAPAAPWPAGLPFPIPTRPDTAPSRPPQARPSAPDTGRSRPQQGHPSASDTAPSRPPQAGPSTRDTAPSRLLQGGLGTSHTAPPRLPKGHTSAPDTPRLPTGHPSAPDTAPNRPPHPRLSAPGASVLGRPRPGAGELYAEADLRGRAAQLARRVLPDGVGVWPAYRVSAGVFVRPSWRHLLPHEL
ncbi:hypothetical protein [Paractinoplanes aksuensis]|uniref:hypothetical protein n=1 Tax=Paractinoplanes aksuensis TaxID=2939490 RepID=UPI00209BC4C5|nr:hypothetical protein [Actinoplanes aksuensis]